MNTDRHLNDLLARRSLSHTREPTHPEEPHEDRDEEEGVVDDELSLNEGRGPTNNSTSTRPQQPTLMDMLMNGNRTTTITVGGSSNVSPAVLDYMRVTNQPAQQGKSNNNANVPVQPENVALDDMYDARYAERIARINKKIETRELDEFDEECGEMDDCSVDHGAEDEDDAMMRELLGEYNGGEGRPPPRKKARKGMVPSSKDSCFLCAFGDRFHDGIRAPHIARMEEIIDKFYGRMNNYDLANCIHLYFKKNVYSEDESMPMLWPQVVLEHLEGEHTMAALNFIVESIKQYRKMKFIAMNNVYKSDGSIDYRAFTVFDKSQTKLEKLYHTKIENMIFANGQTSEDLNSKGSYFNLLPMFSQKEEHLRRLKRKRADVVSATNTFDI